MSQPGSTSNVISAICSFFIPGLGQLVQGKVVRAIFFFIVVSVCYLLAATVIFFFMWFVGAVFHLWSIIDAATNRTLI